MLARNVIFYKRKLLFHSNFYGKENKNLSTNHFGVKILWRIYFSTLRNKLTYQGIRLYNFANKTYASVFNMKVIT